MTATILIYGATGYSGRLIAEEAEQALAGFHVILAGSDSAKLESLAAKHGMLFRSFALDDRVRVQQALSEADVLINAAGPFAWTGERLAKAALAECCHYVDINGELDVYRRLDDLGRYAAQRDLTMVCSAGFTAAASDLLLDRALGKLFPRAGGEREVGSVRIAVSRPANVSRGSAETVWRSLREQVLVMRRAPVWEDGLQRREDEQGRRMVAVHEPVGRHEHAFDFGERPRWQSGLKRKIEIASAANLVDTLTARLTLERHDVSAAAITSYVGSTRLARSAYQLGTLVAPWVSDPRVRRLVRAQISLLPEGPTPGELDREAPVVLLEVEDAFRTRVIDWRWQTTSVYRFTARIVAEIAKRVASNQCAKGWLTPAEALNGLDPAIPSSAGPLRGCRLDQRS